MCKVYAYLRISTAEERGRQRFIRQEQAIARWCKETHTEISERRTYRDDASAKTFDRPAWKELESDVQPGDVIVFKSIDRFTREADAGLDKYMKLMNEGVELVFLDNPTLSTGYMKNLLHIAETQEDRIARESMTFIARILLIAELDRAQKERERISKRTIEGMAARKEEAEKRGEHWSAGRKMGQLDKMTPELESDIRAFLSDRSIKQIDLMNKHNISRNTLKKYIEIVRKEG